MGGAQPPGCRGLKIGACFSDLYLHSADRAVACSPLPVKELIHAIHQGWTQRSAFLHLGIAPDTRPEATLRALSSSCQPDVVYSPGQHQLLSRGGQNKGSSKPLSHLQACGRSHVGVGVGMGFRAESVVQLNS